MTDYNFTYFFGNEYHIHQRTFSCSPISVTVMKTTIIIRSSKTIRSSHRRCSVRKGVLRNFAKFIGKHLCQGLFFNEVAVSGLYHIAEQINGLVSV